MQRNDYEGEGKENSAFERPIAVRTSDFDREVLSQSVFSLRISLEQEHSTVVSVFSLSFCDHTWINMKKALIYMPRLARLFAIDVSIRFERSST
jgi:hypothetical protein